VTAIATALALRKICVTQYLMARISLDSRVRYGDIDRMLRDAF